MARIGTAIAGAVAGTRADMEDLAAQGVEELAMGLERFVAARHHQAHGAGRGAYALAHSHEVRPAANPRPAQRRQSAPRLIERVG